MSQFLCCWNFYEVFVWFLPYVLVRSLWTGLYLAFFLGCLMSNRNKSSGGLEEDLFQHNNFCFLFVKEMYLYLVQKSFLNGDQGCIYLTRTKLSPKDQAHAHMTAQGWAHTVFLEKNNSLLLDFILQQGTFCSQSAARTCSLSVRRPLYGSHRPQYLLSMKSKSHQQFCSNADASATQHVDCRSRQTSKGKAKPPLCSFFFPMQIQPCWLLRGKHYAGGV